MTINSFNNETIYKKYQSFADRVVKSDMSMDDQRLCGCLLEQLIVKKCEDIAVEFLKFIPKQQRKEFLDLHMNGLRGEIFKLSRQMFSKAGCKEVQKQKEIKEAILTFCHQALKFS